MKYIVHDRVVRSRVPEGPLAAHIDSFAEWANKQGYVSCSVYRRVLLGACFSQWLGKKGVRLRDVSSEHPSQYLRYRARQVRIGRGDGAALRQLIAFLRCSGLVPEEKTPRRQPTQRLSNDTCVKIAGCRRRPRSTTFRSSAASSKIASATGQRNCRNWVRTMWCALFRLKRRAYIGSEPSS